MQDLCVSYCLSDSLFNAKVPLLLGVAQVQGGVHLLGEPLNLGMVAQFQGGVHLLTEPLNLGMVVQMDAMRKNALQLQEVYHPVAGGLSLEAHLHVLMLMYIPEP